MNKSLKMGIKCILGNELKISKPDKVYGKVITID